METYQQNHAWIKEFSYLWWKSFVVGASAHLDLFIHLKSFKGIEELREVTGYSERGLRIILDALAAMRVVDKKEESYCLSEKAEPFLGGNDLFSFEGYFEHMMDAAQRWSSLPEVVQTGKPAVSERDPAFFVSLTRSLFAVSWTEAQELHEILKNRNLLNILDIGAGACPWSIPFVKNNPHARLCAIDMLPVIESSTKSMLMEWGVLDQSTLISGNFWDISWGKGYDLVIVGHICHMYGREENTALFEKIRQALGPQGITVIIDYIPDEQKSTRLYPLLFAVNMLVNTEAGDVYSFSQYKEMLSGAGFSEFSLINLNKGQGADVIVATP